MAKSAEGRLRTSKIVTHTIGSAVASHKSGMTYETLRSACSARFTDRASFDRQVVKALKDGEIDIRSGRYVVAKKSK